MSSCFSGGSRELVVLAVALSVLLAQGQDQDGLNKLSAFFEVVGDTLALLALQPGLFCCPAEQQEDSGEVSSQKTS